MALRLNSSRQAYKAFPEEGTASNMGQMPLLIADARVPMSVSQLMQKRLDVRNYDTSVKSAWMDNYFDTGDAVVYRKDGQVKIVLDSQTLREMTPDTQRVGGALLLGDDVYKALQGEEFKRDELGKLGESLSRAQAKSRPVWKALARDKGLLNDYVDYIFIEGKQRFGYDNAMGVYLSQAQVNTPEMRAFCVDRLVYRSNTYGRVDLVSDFGRFVGIAPEALSACEKTLFEEIKGVSPKK